MLFQHESTATQATFKDDWVTVTQARKVSEISNNSFVLWF